jgi:hypothetical protein
MGLLVRSSLAACRKLESESTLLELDEANSFELIEEMFGILDEIDKSAIAKYISSPRAKYLHAETNTWVRAGETLCFLVEGFDCGHQLGGGLESGGGSDINDYFARH